MGLWPLLLVIAMASVALVFFFRGCRKPVGWIALAMGISVFAVRLKHAGPYAVPDGGNLAAGLLSLALASMFLLAWVEANPAARIARRIAMASAPLVLFLALYSVLAEVEEVVVLHATPGNESAADLRLWIVEYDGAGWMLMPRTKAAANGLVHTRTEMTRNGTRRCVDVRQYEDLEIVGRVHRLRSEKYFVNSLAVLTGLFDEELTPAAVALRVDACGDPQTES